MFPSQSRLVSLVVLVSVLAVVCQAGVTQQNEAPDCKHMGKQHNFEFGVKAPGSRLLYSDSVSLKSKLWRINEVDVFFPKSGQPTQGTISYIQVTDLRKDGTGGCATLTKGGPGETFANLHFETLRNHGLDFQIMVYGR